jgi:hypothetical protein
MGYLDGSKEAPLETIEVMKADKKETEANPEYDTWVAKDQ